MSYSRWSSSIWYTFWSFSSPNNIYKKDQIFEICDFDGIQFTYSEIKEDIDACLEEVKLHYSLEQEIIVNENYSVDSFGDLVFSEKKIKKKPIKLRESQLEELREYMLNFIDDVDKDDSLI
jgi:hypothetical protein